MRQTMQADSMVELFPEKPSAEKEIDKGSKTQKWDLVSEVMQA